MPTALHKPRALSAGDVVRVVAPAGHVDPTRLRSGAQILESWGLEVEIGEHVLHQHNSFLSGSDSGRMSDFARAWCDPRVSAVMVARGGYGSQRIIDRMDWEALRDARPGAAAPIFVGCSDVTAMHEAINQQLGVLTLHGPMVASSRFLGDVVSQEQLRAVLFGKEEELGPIGGRRARALVPGRSTGTIAGGNLTLLATGIGTPRQRTAFDGCLLVLEDVAEEPYRIDRMLTHLLRSGSLDGVAGIAAGCWNGCGSPEVIDDILTERLGPLGVPIVTGLDIGHDIRNLTVPLGALGVLDADKTLLWWQAPVLR